MSVYESLERLGITLPQLSAPAAAYEPFVKTGKFIFVSGHIAKREGKPWVGQLGGELSVAEGEEAARGVVIDLIATLHAASGGLDNIQHIIKLMVLVNSTSGFTEQHLVANGASELLIEVFGDRGRHARSAFGVAQVPFGSCVEIDLVAEIK